MDVEALRYVTEIMRRAMAEEAAEPVARYRSARELEEMPPPAIPRRGRSLKEVFELVERMVRLTPRTATKRFFNQLFGGRLWVATGADMLASFLNNSMYTFKAAGVQVLIEREVIRKMCEAVGYEEGEGTFAPGGSISNLVAMVVARNEKRESVRNEGMDGRRYTVYTSDQSHYSIVKNAGIVGLGRKNVRKVDTDERGKMKPRALRERIERDLAAGHVPLLINGTAGTTVLGAHDPLDELAAVAAEYGVWFHVDGAWGGSALLSRRTRHLLAGCERADSFTWDAHKMMGVPLVASAILMRRKGLLKKHFREEATYLFQTEGEEYNPGRWSIQCARRNDALKVWAAWQYYGDEGYAARVDKLRGLAEYAAERVRKHPEMELIVEPEMTNVCFRVAGKSSESVCEALEKRSLMKVGYGMFRGKSCIRLVCVDAALEREDIDTFFDLVLEVARGL